MWDCGAHCRTRSHCCWPQLGRSMMQQSLCAAATRSEAESPSTDRAAYQQMISRVPKCQRLSGLGLSANTLVFLPWLLFQSSSWFDHVRKPLTCHREWCGSDPASSQTRAAFHISISVMSALLQFTELTPGPQAGGHLSRPQTFVTLTVSLVTWTHASSWKVTTVQHPIGATNRAPLGLVVLPVNTRALVSE